MPLRARPIGGVHGGRRVGKLEDYGDAALDSYGDQVLCGMTAGLGYDLLAAAFELTVQSAGPQIEGLPDEPDVCDLFDGEADTSQVQAVRVLAEPIEELLLSVGGGRVADLAAEGVEFSQAEIGRALAGEVGCRVPAPLRLRAQRHLALVRLGKGLQARGVGGEGEFAVADGKRGARVQRVQRRIVARNEAAAVEPGGSTGLCGQHGGDGAEEGTAGDGHAFRVIPFRLMKRASPSARPGAQIAVEQSGKLLDVVPVVVDQILPVRGMDPKRFAAPEGQPPERRRELHGKHSFQGIP